MTSLLKSIAITNFKGFSEEVRLELRPVTLLFGANSAGKSSVLHALQYVREILERNNSNADRTLQGGDAVDLGGFLNLVHGRDIERQIEIELEMSLGTESIPELVPEAFDEWQTSDSDVWDFYNTLQQIRRRVETVSVRLIVGWSRYRDAPVVQGYHVATNGEWCVKFESSKDGRDTRMRINRENPIFMEEHEALDDVDLDLLDDWLDPKDFQQTQPPSLDTEEVAPETQQDGSAKKTVLVSVLGDLFSAVKDAGLEKPGDGLRSWLTQVSGALPRLDQLLSIPAPGAVGAENVYIAREFTAFLSWLTVGPAVLLRDQLRKLRYIGPLRRIPPRGFDVSLTKSESAWSDGMAGWETLMTGPQRLLDECSDWMANSEKLATGYSLERRSVQECDMSQPAPQPVGRPKTKVALIDGNGLRLQPQDVGVGISQVLPVVVAAQDNNGSLVCIEQPELHIHPAVQVGLGDLFVDGALHKGLSFLIETHSEHLVMRLQRRLRESAGGNLPDGVTAVSPGDVNLVYLHRNDAGAIKATSIGLTDEGKFTNAWPAGFFPERTKEVLPPHVRDQLRKGGGAK